MSGAERKRAWRCSRRRASTALKKTGQEIGIGASRDAEKFSIRRSAALDSFRALDSFGRSGGLATCIAGALGVAARRGAAAWHCLCTARGHGPQPHSLRAIVFAILLCTGSAFTPSSKAELKAATDAWMSDASAAEAIYGHVRDWNTPCIRS